MKKNRGTVISISGLKCGFAIETLIRLISDTQLVPRLTRFIIIVNTTIIRF